MLVHILLLSVKEQAWAGIAKSVRWFAMGSSHTLHQDQILVKEEIVCTCPDQSWGPPSLLHNGYWVSFLGFKVAREQLWPPAPSHLPLMPRLREEYSCTSTSPLGLLGLFKGELVTFTLDEQAPHLSFDKGLQFFWTPGFHYTLVLPTTVLFKKTSLVGAGLVCFIKPLQCLQWLLNVKHNIKGIMF